MHDGHRDIHDDAHPRLRRRLRSSAALFASVAVTGCSLVPGLSDDDGPAWDPATVEIGDIDEHLLIDGDLFRINVAPTGDRYATEVDDEICIEPFGTDLRDDPDAEFDAVCFGDPDRSLTIDQIAWSPDGSRLVGTDDFQRFFEEPDVYLVDLETGDFDELTDDGEDEIGDASLIDQAPFFGPDDRVHFFRSEGPRSRLELFRLNGDGEAEEVGRMRLPRDTFPLGSPRFVGDDSWAVSLRSFDEPDGGQLAVLDLENEELEIVELDDDSLLVATTDGLAVVASIEALTRREPDVYSLVSIEDGRERSIRLDLDDDVSEFPTSAGFSPDGSFVAVTIQHSDGFRLVGAPIEDGRTRGEVDIADGDAFRDDPDDRLSGGANLFAGGEIIWTEDGTLVLGRSNDTLLSISTTPG